MMKKVLRQSNKTKKIILENKSERKESGKIVKTENEGCGELTSIDILRLYEKHLRSIREEAVLFNKRFSAATECSALDRIIINRAYNELMGMIFNQVIKDRIRQ